MALTNKQKQQAFRDRKTVAGMKEVRGVRVPIEHHDAFKARMIAAAMKVAKKKV